MSLESPVTIIYNTDGYELALSQSMTIATTQPGLMVAGSSSLGARLIRMSDDGSVFITGSIDAIAAGVQSVTGNVSIDNPWALVTGSNNGLIVNQGLSASNYADAWKVVLTDASGSAIGLSSTSPLWVTGTVTTVIGNTVNVNVTNVVTATITGSVTTKTAGAPTTVVTGVNAVTASYTILPLNTNRAGATFYKTGGGVAYLKLGATASTTSFTVQLKTDAYYELPVDYTGQVDIIFNNAAAGSVVATEINY